MAYNADEIVKICQKQLETSQNYKQPRMKQILENEDIYRFKPKPALQGRINVPFDSVVLSGFVDTLVSQVNRPPKIEFEDPTGANLQGSKKVSAAWERDQKKIRLAKKDRALKKLAALSGRGIAKFYATNDPDYKPHLEIIDYFDFHCEPQGGGFLDDHYFTGQENIFRSKDQLQNSDGWYDKGQVAKLISTYQSNDFKQVQDKYNNKISRLNTLGLDTQNNNYIGGELFNLCEWVTFYNGKQYHLVFEPVTGIWLRCVPLKEDFESDLTPFISFASPQEEPFNFWNLGPADQIKPVAEAIRLNLNEILNNNRKRNWDMKAVDKNIFGDLKQLDWRQDGIVAANVPLGQSIQDGIYRFETPEISGAINLNEYLNNFAGQKLGITSQTQGESATEKVGIYEGNQLQVSKRMKLLSDSYEEMYEDLGVRYDWGLWEHLDDKQMVKLISTDGIGWEKITKDDLEPEYAISVVSSANEQAESDFEKTQKGNILSKIEANSAWLQLVNQKAIIEEELRLSGYSEDKIKKIMDTKDTTSDELLSEAKKAIELILLGKPTKINYGATTGYLQYISDYMLNNREDIKPDKMVKLQAYFDQHIDIAIQNAQRKSIMEQYGIAIEPEVMAEATGKLPINPINNEPAGQNQEPPIQLS